MKVCQNCGKQNNDNAAHCVSCGAALDTGSYQSQVIETKHDIPKCTCCGNIAPWKQAPIFDGKSIVIGLILLCLGVIPGIIWFGTTLIFRSGKGRAKICTKCGARNMFTFLY